MLLTIIYSVLFALTSVQCGLGAGISFNIRCLQAEKTALLQFKQGLIDKSNVLASWETGKDCCEWRGIVCNNKTGHVVTLDLSHVYSDIYNETPLSGVIAPSLLELPYLTYLDLSFFNFQGEIPKFIGSLSRLEQLKLAEANLRGPIPPQLGNLSRLYTLDLSRSDVTFKNLEWLSHLSSLRYLNMSGLNFSEVVNWPESISKLPSLVELHLSSCDLPNVKLSSLSFVNSSNSLQVLELSDNSLDLSIFNWMANVSTNLGYIDLAYNHLQGSVPDVFFANMVSLVSLDLSNNELEGGIPKSFRNLCSLELLDFTKNKLSDRLEDSVENLSCAQDTLESLFLDSNPFSGSFPDNLTRFSSLKELYIDGTNVSGSLAKSFQPLSQLRYLSLVRNKFTGSLPDFTGLSLLMELDISNNQLNGSLPESIGQLSSLEQLDLSWNSLNGVITEVHFSNLSRLKYLDFSQNPLSFNLSSDWNPPFLIKFLGLSSCKVGPTFPKWIQTQTKLTSLRMDNAEISDSIPVKFWDLSSSLVYLSLSMNQIHGKLPNLSTKDCTFGYFDLSSNLLDGPLPPFPSSVGALDLSKNMISGPLSSFCKTEAPDLHFLDLSDNQLSGELPSCWMQFQSLLILNMAKNNFFGKIPSSLGYLKNVLMLHLQDNKLSGELPSLENCTELRVLDLGANKVSGKIPTWIGPSLTGLAVLRLTSNEFYGSIPLSLCSLPALHVLDFSKNNLSGALPLCLPNITALSLMSAKVEADVTVLFGFGPRHWELNLIDSVQLVWKGILIDFGKNLNHLRSIDISSNNLSGDIPESVTSLLNLISLNLSSNNFTGVLPNNFGQLKMLESLDLSRNQISGSIPPSFSSLHYLSVLDLSYNNLSGRIPLSTQLQSFNASQFTGNLGLCGRPLTLECPGDATTEDPAVPNGSVSDQTKQDDDGLISFGFYVSLALGFIIGFWSVCGTLVLKTPWRYAYFRFIDDIKAWIL